MAQSERVAEYISDSESDNDMELKSPNKSEEVKNKTKQNRRKWVPIRTYNNKEVDHLKQKKLYRRSNILIFIFLFFVVNSN
jgi:hypothetical protein